MLKKTTTGLLAGTGAVALGSAIAPRPADAATVVSPDWVNVVSHGADPTGSADSTSAIQAAIDALPSGGGVVYLPAGTYRVSSTVTCTTASAYFVGDGAWATTLAFTGTGDCVRIYDPATYSSRTRYAGGFCGITIDGTHAGAGSTGLHVGDLLQYELDVTVQSFSGTGSIGVHLDNQHYWTEQLRGRIFAQYCTSHVVFDCSGSLTTSSGSFERCDLDIYINQEDANYDGVVFRNGAFTGNGSLRIKGNFASATAAVSSAVLRLAGSTPAGREYPSSSGIISAMLDVGVECGSQPYTPQTIVFGSPANSIAGCYGALNFGIGSDTTFSASNNAGNVSGFQGPVLGDSTLPGPWHTFSTGLPAGWTGHVSCRFLPTGNEVMLSWAFAIAAKTAVTSGETIVTLPGEFHYSANKILPGNLAGAGMSGNEYAPCYVTSTGAFQYSGPAFNSSGAGWWFGQGIYTLSLG